MLASDLREIACVFAVFWCVCEYFASARVLVLMCLRVFACDLPVFACVLLCVRVSACNLRVFAGILLCFLVFTCDFIILIVCVSCDR